MTQIRSASNGLAAAAMMFAAGISTAALAQAQSDVVSQLSPNEGIFIDGKSFSLAKGKAKAGSATAVQQLSARELGPGTIIFRAGDKLYLVEASTRTASLAGKDFQDNWKSAMKDFQDDWKSAMKNYQDGWKSAAKDPKHKEDYTAAMKDIQDGWANYMKKVPEPASIDQAEDRFMQAMKNFQDEWKSNIKGAVAAQAMQDFQDQWKSYVKDARARWSSNTAHSTDTDGKDSGRATVLKQFQDHWATSYVK